MIDDDHLPLLLTLLARFEVRSPQDIETAEEMLQEICNHFSKLSGTQRRQVEEFAGRIAASRRDAANVLDHDGKRAPAAVDQNGLNQTG